MNFSIKGINEASTVEENMLQLLGNESKTREQGLKNVVVVWGFFCFFFFKKIGVSGLSYCLKFWLMAKDESLLPLILASCLVPLSHVL